MKRIMADKNIISREFESLEILSEKENILQMLEHFYSVYDNNCIILNLILELCEKSLFDEI
jgi:hypothetical protein